MGRLGARSHAACARGPTDPQALPHPQVGTRCAPHAPLHPVPRSYPAQEGLGLTSPLAKLLYSLLSPLLLLVLTPTQARVGEDWGVGLGEELEEV